MIIYVTINTDKKTVSVSSDESKDVYFEYMNVDFSSISIEDIVEGAEEEDEI